MITLVRSPLAGGLELATLGPSTRKRRTVKRCCVYCSLRSRIYASITTNRPQKTTVYSNGCKAEATQPQEPQRWHGPPAKSGRDSHIVRSSGGSRSHTSAQPRLTSQQKTLELVECAMLAACVGLAFTIASQLRLELYISLFYSLPVVIGAIRWGESAALRTVVTTFLLVFCLAGP